MKSYIKAISGFKSLSLAIFLIIMATVLLLTKQNNSQAQIPDAPKNYLTDQNGDGIINLVDARIVSPPDTTNCPACVDVNGDGKVDDKDEKKVRKGIERVSSGGRLDPRFDFNNDGKFDDADIQILAKYQGQTLPAGSFGLDKPEHLSYGYRARELVVGFKRGYLEADVKRILEEENLPQIEIIVFNVPDGRPLSQLNDQEVARITKQNQASDLRTPTGQIPQPAGPDPLEIAAILAKVSTQNLVNPDDLDNNARQIKDKRGEMKYVEKEVLGAGILTDDPFWDRQWGIRAIDIDDAWRTETKGHREVKVAVLDTGVDMGHPDLVNQRFADARNTLDDNNNVDDEVGHGTGMAGIIVAQQNNNVAIAGIAPNVTIIPVKISNTIFTGDPFPVAEGIDWAVDHGAHVINMSFETTRLQHVDDAITLAQAFYSIELIASAGNEGANGAVYPASHPRVIGIGAAGQRADGSWYIWPDSNRGDEVAFFAPGVDIPMLWVPDTVLIADGTSQAAAYTSGVAALMRSVCDDNPARNTFDLCAYWLLPEGNNFYVLNGWNTAFYPNCFRADNPAHNHRIDVQDAQMIAFFMFERQGDPGYSPRLDIWPADRDGRIGAIDLQFVLARHSMICPSWHFHP